MWRLGPHNDTLLWLYRFRDSALQARFTQQSQGYHMKVAQLHLYVQVVLGITNICSFSDALGSDMSPLFWAYVAITCLSVLFLGLTHLVPILRRRILPLHCLFCFILMAVTSYLVLEKANSWTKAALDSWLPTSNNTHTNHLVLVKGEQSLVVDDRFHSYVLGVNTQQSYAVSVLETTPTYLCLALCGLNVYTLPIHMVVLGSLIIGLLLTTSWSSFQIVQLVFLSAAYFGLSALIERFRRWMFLSEVLLARELHASQTADSILNHTLKNTLADVAGIIEMYLAGARERVALEDAVACLKRGMKSCRERQVYLKLVAGEYTPVLNEVRLQEFGENLIAGRPVEGNFADLTVYLDYTLCNLVLENALSNALKHGDPSNPDVALAIQASSVDSHLGAGKGVRVRFVVSNAADPRRPPLTMGVVEGLMTGNVELPSKQVTSTLSDRIGLAHCRMAAQQGGLDVALWQEGSHVFFQVEVDAELAPDEVEVVAQHGLAPPAFPEGLRYCVIDDSATAQRLLEFYLNQYCAPASVHCFGTEEDDVGRFLEDALQSADVVLVDQHLEFSHTYLGTDLVQQLLARGFRGLICIRSGDDSAEDRVKYAECGAHCSVGKDVLGSRMVEELKRAYRRLSQAPPPPRPSAVSSLWAVAVESSSFMRPSEFHLPDRSASPSASATFHCVMPASQTDLLQQPTDLTSLDDEGDARRRQRALLPPFLRGRSIGPTS